MPMTFPPNLIVPTVSSPSHIIPPVFQTCRTHIDLDAMLYKLRNEHSIETLMVEGGATVIGHFLEQKLYNSLVITICPKFIGQGISIRHTFNQPLTKVSYHKFGEDIVLLHKT
jgi:riboflavin biosynthesis pyrimidine reductase